MRFFITGANGFLGHALLPRLLERGEVEALVRPEIPDDLPEAVRRSPGDVLDPATLTGARRADVVLHLAAVSSPPLAAQDPSAAFRVNAEGTLNVLEAARGGERLRRFVHFSTGQVYGRPTTTPVDEAHPLRPSSVYGATKLAGEALAFGYHGNYGLPVTVVRPFNVYGPGQTGPFLIPDALRQVGQGVVRMGDGRPKRDFLFVDDLVDLVLRLIDRPEAVGEAFNAGSGEAVAVEHVVRRAVHLAGAKDDVRFDASKARAGDVPEIAVDVRKAGRLLDWRPRTSLDEGLATTVKAFGRRAGT